MCEEPELWTGDSPPFVSRFALVSSLSPSLKALAVQAILCHVHSNRYSLEMTVAVLRFTGDLEKTSAWCHS